MPRRGLDRAREDALAAVARGWGLRGADGIHAVRGIRAALHGFVTIERV